MSDVADQNSPGEKNSSLPSNVDQLRKAAHKRFKAVRSVQGVKKYALGTVGAAVAIGGVFSSAASTPPPALAQQNSAIVQTGPSPDGAYTIKNHERWPIKTSITSDPLLSTPVVEDITEFANFKPVAPGSVKTFVDKFIPLPAKTGLSEGQIVQTEGYIHLVAFEGSDDSDYHVQMNASPTNDPSGLTPCLIVEIPHPLAAANPNLAAQFAAARKLLRDNCFAGGPPTETVKKPLHVRVTGQLFYDLSHSGSTDPGGHRGKPVGGKPMHATTIWEIHPVTQIEIIP